MLACCPLWKSLIRFSACNGFAAGRPVFRHFAPQKRHALLQLCETIHTVFNADPTIESNVAESPKNRIKVVQASSDDTMPQSGCVPAAIFFTSKIIQCSFD